mgnify:CR=1 FL=1
MQLIKNDFGKSYSIELLPNASATDLIWKFPDIPFLRDKFTTGINLSYGAFGVTSGKLNIAPQVSNLYPSFLTLVDNSGDLFIQNLPLAELSATQYIDTANTDYYAQNSNGYFVIKPRIVVWNKCFVKFPTATALANVILQFNIFYK